MAVLDDPASVLEHFINDVANLPAEITHLYEELQAKDVLLQECRALINSRDASIQKFIKLHGSLVKNPKEEAYEAVIMQNYDRAIGLQQEKVRLSEKVAHLIDRHVKRLDIKLRDLQNDGTITLDPTLPSLLRDAPGYVGGVESSLSTGVNTPLNQLSGNASGGAANLAQNAIISRIVGTTAPTSARGGSPTVASVQQSQASGGSQPSQATVAMNRNVRELSVSSDTKRRRFNASLGNLPAPSSGLARQSSLGPGTPKAQTPGSRAGSAGPKAIKKGPRKVPPQQLRKKVGIRSSNLSKKARNRAPGTSRASPSTTADDESVLSGEGSDDENTSAGVNDEVAEGDMEVDEGDEDNTKYCVCQKVSHGDMVACDWDGCPYQWFHWGCVGITEEPKGEWFCEHCRPLLEKHLEKQKKQKKK